MELFECMCGEWQTEFGGCLETNGTGSTLDAQLLFVSVRLCVIENLSDPRIELHTHTHEHIRTH